MPDSDNKIPVEMLSDIVLVFLVGLEQKHSDMIRSNCSDIWSTWTDVVGLRKRIASVLKSNVATYDLGMALETTFRGLEGGP